MRSPIFPLTLICLCSNIRGVGMCGEGFVSSSLLLSPSGLDFGKLSAVLTLNLPTCRHTAVLQRKQSVSLSAGHLRYFQRWWKILEQTWCQLEKNKVPSEVKKHTVSLSCSVVKLVYSISLANIPKTGTATADPLRWRQNNVNNRGNTKEKAYSFMALSCVDLMFLSPCVYVCLCVHASATKKKWNSLWEEKKAWFLIMRLLACPIYGNQHSPRGWKTRDAEEREAEAEEKINTALWNKKCGLFTLHWSDDAGETPHSAIKLRV